MTGTRPLLLVLDDLQWADDATVLLIRDLAEPPHILRWVNDERLLVSGADAESGPAKLRDQMLVQRTGQ